MQTGGRCSENPTCLLSVSIATHPASVIDVSQGVITLIRLNIVMNDNSKSNPDENSIEIHYDSDHHQFDLANSGRDNECDSYNKGFSHSEIVNEVNDKSSSSALSWLSKDTKSNEFKNSFAEVAGADFDVSKEILQRSVSVPNDDPNKTKRFSTQLYYMLNIETNAGSRAVQWLPDGRGFVIRNQNQFEQMLPKYFDTCIFQSFLRRLNR